MKRKNQCLTYLSMNCFCCSTSAPAKNSSISCAVGMCLWDEFCILRLVSAELVALVVEPGVLMVSGSLIRLQGVDSLVLLSQRRIMCMMWMVLWITKQRSEKQKQVNRKNKTKQGKVLLKKTTSTIAEVSPKNINMKKKASGKVTYQKQQLSPSKTRKDIHCYFEFLLPNPKAYHANCRVANMSDPNSKR